MLGSQGIVPPRTFDTISPRQCPTKKYRLAITTLRTPDARSAQSNIVIVRFQSYAPTLRCRCVVTPRLVANKDYVTVPSLRPRRGFAALAKCFRMIYYFDNTQPMSVILPMYALMFQLFQYIYSCFFPKLFTLSRRTTPTTRAMTCARSRARTALCTTARRPHRGRTSKGAVAHRI